MSKLVAAVDSSAVARPVLAVASALAVLLDVGIEAVFVGDDDTHTVRAEADAFAVPLLEVSGPVAKNLYVVAEDDDVVALVVGTRGLPGASTEVGHVTKEIIATLHKPIVVVPPELANSFALELALAPLDGTPEASEAIRDTIRVASERGLEVVVLHVFDEASLPMFGDQLQHEVPGWAAEFLARWCPEYAERVRLELRVGFPPQKIVDVLASLRPDLVLLGWSQDLATGHAAVVQRALHLSRVPVVLLPVPERA